MRVKFTAEFHQVNILDDESPPLSDLLAEAFAEGRTLIKDESDPVRLIRDLYILDNGFTKGVIWKIKKDDLPTAGTPEGREREIELAAEEGLVYKNHFLLYPRHQVLVYQRYREGLTANQFADFLSDMFGLAVSADPIVERDAIERMMRGGTVLKRAAVTVAHPTNPEVLQGTELERHVMAMHHQAGGSSIHLRLGSDIRSPDEAQRSLTGAVKTFIRNLVEAGASRSAKVEVEDANGRDVIDLISDRILSEQELEVDGPLAAQDAIFEALTRAYNEKRRAIQDYFGR